MSLFPKKVEYPFKIINSAINPRPTRYPDPSIIKLLVSPSLWKWSELTVINLQVCHVMIFTSVAGPHTHCLSQGTSSMLQFFHYQRGLNLAIEDLNHFRLAFFSKGFRKSGI